LVKDGLFRGLPTGRRAVNADIVPKLRTVAGVVEFAVRGVARRFTEKEEKEEKNRGNVEYKK